MNFFKKFTRYENLLTFLIMELLALTSFALGGNNVIFYVIGFVLAIFGLLINLNKFEKKELVSLAAMGIPVILIAIFVAFGTPNQSKPVFENIFVFFAIISFFALGLFARRMKSLKIETVLYCIGFGLAMLTLISMIYSWISYGFFYSLVYKDTPNYYYNGAIFDITKESAFLFGFKFKEVTTNYTGLYGIILICFVPGLLFISPKKDKMKFIIVSFIGFVGVLSILSVPNFKALLYLIPVILVTVLLKFLYSEKTKIETKKNTRKIVYYGFVGLVILLVIFFVLSFLNATGVMGFNEVVNNNAFLSKIFNNGRFMMPINYVLNQSVLEYNLFGFVNSMSYWQTQVAFNTKTYFFEFELVKEGGIFALVVLVFLIVITFSSVSRYSSKGKDTPFIKAIVISLMLGIFIYATFAQDSFPFIHDNETYSSFFRSLPALILLFLMGYTFYPDLKKDEVPAFENEVEEVKEEIKEEEGEYVDDYTFTTDEEEESNEK